MKVNYEKLSKLDIELLENHETQIIEIKTEKREQILNTLKNKLGILFNLINDIEFIENIEKYVPDYIERYLGTALYYLLKDNQTYLNKTLNNFVDNFGLELSITRYNKHEYELKKAYLKQLNKAKNIKTE